MGDVPGRGLPPEPDRAFAGPGRDTWWTGFDRLHGGRDGDRIVANGGHNLLLGGAGGDVSRANGGNDRGFANRGIDESFGAPGNDDLWASPGPTSWAPATRGRDVHGEDGNDASIPSDSKVDRIDCGRARTPPYASPST